MRRAAVIAASLGVLLLPSLAVAKVHTEKGIASWYGGKFIGRRTASGEIMDRHRLTAAHRHLPLGTVLLVTNRRNGRKVIVTVNDRGPMRHDRIIDLSPAAAAQLGMQRKGLAQVEIRPVKATARSG
jgi:rare lipoprotein A